MFERIQQKAQNEKNPYYMSYTEIIFKNEVGVTFGNKQARFEEEFLGRIQRLL